jgi:hypothetical protein
MDRYNTLSFWREMECMQMKRIYRPGLTPAQKTEMWYRAGVW